VEDEIVFLDGRGLSELIRTRRVSPVEVVEAHLRRIEEWNPRLNAFITVTAEEALARAREAERAIGGGRYLGPLHGVPYAVKDILATRGIRTTNGSRITADWVPGYESTITERLNRAGAILLGKLNLSEYAMGSQVHSGFGPARNPWHLEHSPAGSSGASGVALAAHMATLTVGTDTGGSIRGPASANGIVGMKQTYGRVSRYGVSTLAWTLDHAGPMTRTVADNAAMLQVMAGHDPLDPSSADEPVPDYGLALREDVRGVRIGVPTNYFFDDVSPEVERGVREAVETLRRLGARIVEVDIPHAPYAGSAGWLIAMAEGACYHEKRLREQPELFDPLILERLEAARFYTATDYIKAQRVRSVLIQEMKEVFRRCDVMAVPGSGSVAGRIPSPEAARTDVTESDPPPYRPGSTFIGNMTGLPAMTMPCGFSSGSPRLPLSVQFYARPFDELAIYRVGHAYESATGWHRERAPLAAR
jgi:aspartyl-tRNA(Asn)/glutamyl-tRNA(Gln) amidotransferase subunit A